MAMMEIRLWVKPESWWKFEQMYADTGKDRSEIFSEIVDKTYAEFEAKKQKEEETKRNSAKKGRFQRFHLSHLRR